MFKRSYKNNIFYSNRKNNLSKKANTNRYNNRNDDFFQGNIYQMDLYSQNDNDNLNELTCLYQTKTNDNYQYNRIYNTNSFNNHNFYSSSTQKQTRPNFNDINSFSVNEKNKILKFNHYKKQEIPISQTHKLNIEKNANFNVIQINKSKVNENRLKFKKIHPGRGTSTSFISIYGNKKIKRQPELKYQSFNESFISNGVGLKNKRNKSSVKLRKNNLEDLNIDKLKDYAEKFSGIFLSKKKNNNNNNNTPKKSENNNTITDNKNITINSISSSAKKNTNSIRINTNSSKDNDYSNKNKEEINDNKNNNSKNNTESNVDDNKKDKKTTYVEKYINIQQPQKIINNNKKIYESNASNKIHNKNRQVLIPKKEKFAPIEEKHSQCQLNTNINIEKSQPEISNKKNLIKKTKNLSSANSIATADDTSKNNNNLKKSFLFHNINNTAKTTEHKFIQKYNNQKYHEIVFKKSDCRTNEDNISSNEQKYYLENINNDVKFYPKNISDNLNFDKCNDNDNYNSKENIFYNYKKNKYKYKNYGLDDRHNLDGISNHSYFESVNLKKNNKK